jgi:hypothetical protein
MHTHKVTLALATIAATGMLGSSIAVAASQPNTPPRVELAAGPLPGHCGTNTHPCPQ